MNFINSIKTFLKKYATFSGRAPLSEFWKWWAIFFVFNIILNPIGEIIEEKTGTLLMMLILSPITLPTLAIMISIWVKRLHDIGISGWWMLLPFAPITALIIDNNVDIFSHNTAETIKGLITIYYLAILIMIIGRKGTKGDNKFGKDPLQKNTQNDKILTE